MSASQQTYTLEELNQYTGQETAKPILLGLNGKVYDVTSGSSFYGPGSSYNVFAGRDSTKGLATGSLDASSLPGPKDDPVDLDSLNEQEQQAALSWQTRLSAKYPVAGVLVKSAK